MASTMHIIDAAAKSWVEYDAATSAFPLQNLPYGVFVPKEAAGDGDATPRCAVAIGDSLLDLHVLADAGLLGAEHAPLFKAQTTLNAFMASPRAVWTAVRARLATLLSADCAELRDASDVRARALRAQSSVRMVLPATIGDYTDFYSSREHATNVGVMFRGKDNALQPNWLHLPVGYHGRSSSVVVSGTPLRRPCGQLKPPEGPPKFGASSRLDVELEMGFFVGGPGNALGEPIAIADAERHIFGLVLLNDWSARDIQKWEYVPLGPFGAKNFGTTVSPWVVTLDALEPFRVESPAQREPEVLPYLRDPCASSSYDVGLAIEYRTASGKRATVARGSFKHMYWTMKQQLVHHSITGCNMRAGDLLGSGTISGPTEDSYGSLLELTWNGSKKLSIDGDERTFLLDGDSINLVGSCAGKGFNIGFGECEGTILPAHKIE